MEKEVPATGINLGNYTADKAAGLISVDHPVASSENFRYFKPQWAPATDPTGKPIFVEAAPISVNFNRGNLADYRKSLDADKAALDKMYVELDALLADMDALAPA